MKEFQLMNVTLDDSIFFPAYVVVGEDWNGFALPYFSLEQGKRLCEYFNEGKNNLWVVINLTDEIIASEPMPKEDAENFVKELTERFKSQGYYLTASGERINPENVKLEIKSAHDTSHESFYKPESDSFIIYEQAEDEESEPIEYPGEEIAVSGQVVRVYPIGAGSWIWSVATQLN